jgi:hypothetical protein
MANAMRASSPHVREPLRPGRLLIQARKREAGREREPELLPAICPSCLGVIGLAELGEDRWCRDCGIWVAVDESFGLTLGIAG